MARTRGRKSNPAAKRRQTTADGQGRGPADVVQVNPLLRKVDAAEAYARAVGDTARLARIEGHRQRLAGIVAEMIAKLADIEDTEGRMLRTARAGFVRASTAGHDAASRLRGDVSVLESRYRNMVHAIVADLGMCGADAGYPIDMLLISGKLVGPGEEHVLGVDRCERGSYFAGLHWKLYGRTPKAQDNGYVAPINAEQIQQLLERAKSLDVVEPMSLAQRDWLDAARYNALRLALLRRGSIVEQLVVSVCCHMRAPAAGQMALLRQGLSGLLSADLPSRDDVPEILVEEVA